MVDEPPQSIASLPLALVFIPQPRLTVGLPVKLIPVSALGSMLSMQYLPLWTSAAVALAEIVGAAVMNRLEKGKVRWTETVTRTACVVVAQAPVVGGVWTAQVGVVPSLAVTLPSVMSRAIGVLAVQAPVVTVWLASSPNTPARAALSAARWSCRCHVDHPMVSVARPAEPITNGSAAAAIRRALPRRSRQSFFK